MFNPFRKIWNWIFHPEHSIDFWMNAKRLTPDEILKVQALLDEYRDSLNKPTKSAPVPIKKSGKK